MTLGLKNTQAFGCISDKFKGKYHIYGMGKVVVDVNLVKKPDFTIIDGLIAMEGKGPIHGDSIKMDLVIAGKDPVAIDSFVASVMGFNSETVYLLKKAYETRVED